MPELRARSRTPSTSRSGAASPEKSSSPRKGAPDNKGCRFNFCAKWSAQCKQQGCTAGWFVLALVIVAGAVCATHHRCDWKVNAANVGERIAFALRNLAFSALILAGLIKYALYKRFTTGAINLNSGNERHVDHANRLIQNTLEQFVVHSALILALSTYLAADQLKFVTLFVGFFVLGRLLFILGYPTKRCFGFALGWIPNALAFWGTVYFMYTRGIAAF